jgi:NAD(P)-dependent dehydrogenase (short-subunit alcohol dehydrogenase family)
MDGTTVVITGANAGVGKATAVGLARAGATVIMTARDRARGVAALNDVREQSGSDAVELMSLDLASFASIRTFADELQSRHDRLDVLVNNAGLVSRTRTETEDGFETTFGVNHLGHFLLTSLLLGPLRAGAPSRIVVVASHAHKQARRGLDFTDLQSERKYSPMAAYARSKLANIYFARELARRLDGSGVTANSLHPGFVGSRFGRDGDGGRFGDVVMALARPLAISPEKGARTSIWLASAPSLAGVTGDYFYKCKPSTPSAVARDDEAARRLWAVSEELVATSS